MQSSNKRLIIEFIPRHIQRSEFDWVDLSTADNERVGKARCLKNGDSLIIFSINIYPDWKSQGFGSQFVEYCKANFREVVADRVRPTAEGFWAKKGFKDRGDGDWIYLQPK